MRKAFLHVLDSRGNRIPRASLSASSYEGATTGRRLQNWGLSSSGPNTALYQSLGSLRSRSRELIRNNPLVDGGVDSYAANIVGSGISPRWQMEDTDLKMRIQELWTDWTDYADFGVIPPFKVSSDGEEDSPVLPDPVGTAQGIQDETDSLLRAGKTQNLDGRPGLPEPNAQKGDDFPQDLPVREFFSSKSAFPISPTAAFSMATTVAGEVFPSRRAISPKKSPFL